MKKTLLVLIVLLAFFLRFYRVIEIPPSLNWDETSIGYNAYSILLTGKDEWGVSFPLHFKSFGEYKLPTQIYASIPGIAIFGLNELGVRITPVVYGTLTVLFLYFLTNELFRNKDLGLISAFLLAVSPWHIQLTRASFESSFSVLWVVIGIWFLVKGFKNPKWWIASAIPFALAIYTYNSARVFVPLFLLSVLVLFWKKICKAKRGFLIAASIFLVLLVPLVPFTLKGEAAARYKLVSITDDPGLIPRIEQRRNQSTLPPLVTKLIHNRPVYISYYFLENYLSHFTPDFLFISGAPHKQHHVQGIGELYLIQAPFLVLGIYFLLKTKYKFRGLLFSWLLLAFVPVSMTNDTIPHALRTLIAVPTYQIFTAVGIDSVYKALGGKFYKTAFIGLLLFGFLSGFYKYLDNYYVVYPKAYSRDWQYGYKQVVQYIKEHGDDYDLVIFSRHYGEPHIFTLFWLGWDPAKYQNDQNLVRKESHDWVWVNAFDKFKFPDLGDVGTGYKEMVEDYPDKKILFIGKSGDFPEDKERLLRVNFLNDEKAFEIVEEIPNQ